MYKLGRVRVDNFKSIAGVVEKDFTGADAIILDGPNGFGKTTIFDAIELCLTGHIGRISSAVSANDSRAKGGHLLKNSNSKETFICVELYDSESLKRLVLRARIPSKITGQEASVRNYSGHIFRDRADAWDSEEWTPILPEEVEAILGIGDMARMFHVQHYIQQEDAIGFIKKNTESNRHVQLSRLFGTEEQTNAREKIGLIKKKVNDALKKDQLDLKLVKEWLAVNAISPEEPAIEKLPSGMCLSLSQSEAEGASKELLSSYLQALEGIKRLIESPGSYGDIKNNNLIDVLISSRKQELNDLMRVGCVEDYARIERLSATKGRWLALLAKVKERKEFLRLLDADGSELKEDLLSYLEKNFSLPQDISTKIELLREERRNSGVFGKVIQRILHSRQNLFEGYVELCDHQIPDPIECPLCGQEKEQGLGQLLQEFESRTSFFARNSGAAAALIDSYRASILALFVKPIEASYRAYVEKFAHLEGAVYVEFFRNKVIDADRFQRMSRVRSWMAKNGIDYAKFIDGALGSIAPDYNYLFESLILLISGHKTAVKDDLMSYSSTVEAKEILGVGEDYFSAQDTRVVIQDIEYVRYVIKRRDSDKYSAESARHSILLSRIESLEALLERVEDTHKIYTSKIREYESSVSSRIAVPFYIYSSKILQTRPEGAGIFLRIPETGVPYLRFCSSMYDDHDALFTMSSGQLSGLVIAFALAMNKLYPSLLKVVLIDDPMQCMDEINMASLTQLFRYEFVDYQIMLSTHEEKISGYLSYKLGKAGRSIVKQNMRELIQLGGDA